MQWQTENRLFDNSLRTIEVLGEAYEFLRVHLNGNSVFPFLKMEFYDFIRKIQFANGAASSLSLHYTVTCLLFHKYLFKNLDQISLQL